MIELLLSMLQDARLAKPLIRRCREYEELLRNETANVHLLEKVLAAIRKQVALLAESDRKAGLRAWCAEQEAKIKTLRDEFRYRFGTDLKAALAGHNLDLEGQFPLLRAGFYAVKVDFDAGYARVFWGPEVEVIRSKTALSAQEVAKAITGFDSVLKRREFHAPAFLRHLQIAYERSLRAADRPDNAKVPITEVMGEVAFMIQPKRFAANPVRENFQDYSRIQFGFDLHRLRQEGEGDARISNGKALRLFVANFDSTIEKGKSLWVPDNNRGAGTYFSYLSFEAAARDDAPAANPTGSPETEDRGTSLS